MPTLFRWLAAVAVLVALTGCAQAPAPATDTWPARAWRHASPEQHGVESGRLAAALTQIEAQQLAVRSLLIIRDGVIVADAYFDPYQADTAVGIQSITKSVIGLLVGIAIQQGRLEGVDQKLVDLFPDRTIAHLDTDKRAITLEHLLTMTSGFDCADNAGTTNAMLQSADWVQFMLDLPMAEAPGRTFRYCSGNAHLLSAILQEATGQTAREFANTVLFGPLNIPEVPAALWLTDPSGYSDGSAGLWLTPEDVARLGWLYVTNGRWDGQPLVPAAWVADSLKDHIAKGDGSSYGYLWTVYPGDDHAAALGLGGQQLHVYPQQRLVVVVTGGMPIYDQIPAVADLLAADVRGAVTSSEALVPQADGVQQLRAAIDRVSRPLTAVQPGPTVVSAISGVKYRLDANPFGYEALTLTFQAGRPDAVLTLDPFPPMTVGLDHVYRLNPNPGSALTLAIRGNWLDDATFEIHLATIGELGDTRSQLVFSGRELQISITDAVFGNPLGTLRGRADE